MHFEIIIFSVNILFQVNLNNLVGPRMFTNVIHSEGWGKVFKPSHWAGV